MMKDGMKDHSPSEMYPQSPLPIIVSFFVFVLLLFRCLCGFAVLVFVLF